MCIKHHLTHWGWVRHLCISKQIIIVSNNGLSPGRCQAIIWTNAGILLIGLLGINSSEIFNQNVYIFIHENAFENVWKIAAILSRPQCDNSLRPIWTTWTSSAVQESPLNLITHSLRPRDSYMHHWMESSLVQVMVWLLEPSHFLNQCWLHVSHKFQFE